MRAKLVKLLKRLVQWLEQPESDEFTERIAALVKKFDALAQSGEYKRHQVYALAIKEFPTVAKHKIGLAIEQAVVKERE